MNKKHHFKPVQRQAKRILSLCIAMAFVVSSLTIPVLAEETAYELPEFSLEQIAPADTLSASMESQEIPDLEIASTAVEEVESLLPETEPAVVEPEIIETEPAVIQETEAVQPTETQEPEAVQDIIPETVPEPETTIQEPVVPEPTVPEPTTVEEPEQITDIAVEQETETTEPEAVPETVPEETQPVTEPETTTPETTQPESQTEPATEEQTSETWDEMLDESEKPTKPEKEKSEKSEKKDKKDKDKESKSQSATTQMQDKTQESKEQAIADRVSHVPITIAANHTPYQILVSGADDQKIADTISAYLGKHGKKLNDVQKWLLQACASVNAAPGGFSNVWVRNVYASAGFTVEGDAYAMRYNECYSNQEEDLQPGMIVAVTRSNANEYSWGYYHGHAGIYIGDGMIVDSAVYDGYGVKSLQNLKDWIKTYDVSGTVMWGYPAVVLEYMSNNAGMQEQTAEAKMVSDGVQLSWDKEAGAFGYLLYKDNEPVANIRNNQDSYIDRSSSAGENVCYTVKPYTVKWQNQEGTQDLTENISAIMQEPIGPGNIQGMMNAVPAFTKEDIVGIGVDVYGLDARWLQMLIGTTEREAYYNDPYLLYSWACVMLNSYRKYTTDSVYSMMHGWGSAGCQACGHYYGEHAVVYGCGYHSSYSSASDITLRCVLLALLNRDYRIIEVDGMIGGNNIPGGYQLLYNSGIYNCQVWAH